MTETCRAPISISIVWNEAYNLAIGDIRPVDSTPENGLDIVANTRSWRHRDWAQLLAPCILGDLLGSLKIPTWNLLCGVLTGLIVANKTHSNPGENSAVSSVWLKSREGAAWEWIAIDSAGDEQFFRFSAGSVVHKYTTIPNGRSLKFCAEV